MNTDALLNTRASTHGDYTSNAINTQMTMEVWMKTPNWRHLTFDQKETLHMLAHKVSRALCGNHNEPDHWDDMAGYAKLTADRCRERMKKMPEIEALIAKGEPDAQEATG